MTDLDTQIEKAKSRVNSFIYMKCCDLQRDQDDRLQKFEEAYDRAITTINFKAVIAEGLGGWDKFKSLPSTGGYQFAEIL